MKPSSGESLKKKAAVAALSILSTRRWEGLDIAAVAKKCGCSQESLKKIFPSIESLTPFIVKAIDDLARKKKGAEESGPDPADVLFDKLMNRFEAMEPYRLGLSSMADCARTSPSLAYLLYKALNASMASILASVFKSGNKAREKTRNTALLGLYALSFFVWREDFSPDLSKTMAALNRHIQLCQKIGLWGRDLNKTPRDN